MLIYYIIVTLASVATIVAAYLGYDMNWIAQKCAQRGSVLLFVTLAVKPFAVILGPAAQRKPRSFLWQLSCRGMKYRRLLGITTFLILFVHAGVNFGVFLKMGYAFSSQITNLSFLFGYIGLALLFVGYITSNDLSVGIFKKYRKHIQRVAYLALILGVLHVFILSPAQFRGYLLALIIYLYLKGVEKWKLPFFKLSS